MTSLILLFAAALLPGEPATTPALGPYPFPDRLSAYVWRNWGLVEPSRLAGTVGATEEEIRSVAADLGLGTNVTVAAEWRRKGYITVLRRNWHLLPYEQLLKVLDMTREELDFSLKEDDFLWHKLGLLKPLCEPLSYRPPAAAETAARRRIAAVLREEGLDPAAEDEEPRFAFVRELAAPRLPSPVSRSSDSPFDFRMIFSCFADYVDPLADPEVSSYPEGLLERLSAEGVNAVWLHVVLRTLVKDPKYPEFGEGSERRLANLQKLVDRAARHGVRVYLYLNEPRGLPESFFAVPGRADLAGAAWRGRRAMCTSHPETRRWVTESVRRVFSTVRGLGGIFTITASENLTNCSTHEIVQKSCPRCAGKPRAEIIGEATAALVEGVARGDPSAEAIVYDWGWPRTEKSAILARLPRRNVRLLTVSERGMPICRGGVAETERDYSISIVGPGDIAREAWRVAREQGFGTVAKVQVNTSWELSPFPCIPAMDLVARQAVNLSREGVTGVMLSWSCGCYPSPNLSVYELLRKGETETGPVLDRLAWRLYGDRAPAARAAWTAFSEGFTNFPFAIGVLYRGPQQWGPANPLYREPTGWKATMVGIPYDDLKSWRADYPAETWIDLMQKTADGFEKGCRLMEGVASPRELNLYRAEAMHFASSADQARFVLARDRGDADGQRAAAERELRRARDYWRLVRADSRIGYEPSNHYFYVPRDLLEKVLSCRAVLDGTKGGGR